MGIFSMVLSLLSGVALFLFGMSLMAEFSGWLSLYIEPAIYWKMFLMGMAVYALVALLQFFRISKIPMETALKNIE